MYMSPLPLRIWKPLKFVLNVFGEILYSLKCCAFRKEVTPNKRHKTVSNFLWFIPIIIVMVLFGI